ncbi:SDR family NAD(P)-dependent oxidoreductase [Nonomuraea pusilla]|uniref:SDR family NAD(P)-dependent oxidoreductase n=1 Tax=Nonomuraea pusilla TaxID=46177 RepID=UPI00332F6CE9
MGAPPDGWRRTFEVNVHGTFNTCRAFAPGMRDRGWGRIVNIASMAGKDGNPNMASYSASKAAVIGLTKSLGKELATSGVLANVIAPAVIETPMNAATAPEALAHITSLIPMRRIGHSHDAQIAPHCPLGPVALAACLQLDAAVPNFHTQETVIEVHDPGAGLGLELLADPTVLRPVAGRIPVLTGPGLGIEIDEEAVREAVVAGPLSAGAHTWLYEDDGSFAEW